jgi:hypothetical protein
VEAYYDSGAVERRPFIVTPYRVEEEAFVPAWPDACPFAGLEERCSLTVNHWRERATGPEHPVLVLECKEHGHAFTVYPCGHVPYGRAAIAPVSEDGEVLGGQAPWRATALAAVLDAEKRELWPRDSPAGDPRRRRTQSRGVAWAGALLGLDGGRSVEALSRLAVLLGLPTQDLLDAARELPAAAGLVARGAVIAAVLARLPLGPCVLDAVLRAGALAGLWGPPIRFEPVRGRRRFLFPPSGTPP